MQEIESDADNTTYFGCSSVNDYLFLEVLIDIRDQLVEVAKLRYIKIGNIAQIYSKDEDDKEG